MDSHETVSDNTSVNFTQNHEAVFLLNDCRGNGRSQSKNRKTVGCNSKSKQKITQMAHDFVEHVFKIVCMNFGAILMSHYGVTFVKLKKVVHIWHSEIKAVKNCMSLRAFFIKINIFYQNILMFWVNF